MFTPKPQLSLRNATEYFREHLSVGDYYAEGQQVAGEWFGLAAEQLGLKGKVGEADFLHLCEGLHPATGQRLTQRKNSRRQEEGKSVANRRVFHDFTISPPKSVSVVALYQDDRILALHNRAVKVAMGELEKFAATRVRRSNKNEDRVTGSVVAASFQHDTSRELDPHLHTHCVVFNATFDSAENRWKALQTQGMYRAQKFAENLYYHELCKGLKSLGYEIQNGPRYFEIKGVPQSVITKFSKRHRQIDEETQKKVADEGRPVDLNALRRQVARDDRKRKIKDSTASKLRPLWAQQMTKEEVAALETLRQRGPERSEGNTVTAALAWADEHLFERRSVVADHELMAAALGRGRGQDFDLAELREAVSKRDYIHEAGTDRITSREVLGCELEIVLAAKEGRGAFRPLNARFSPSEKLSDEQKTAVAKILGSHDFITLFRGGAGTGKSFTLKEVARGLSAANRPIIVLAPQRQQVGDLRADGLPAETLARFLQTKEMRRGAVVIVDEAGQIGGRDLRELIRVVQANAGRIILSGDTRQHGAVAATDALRAIEKHSKLKPAVVRQIRRQNPEHGSSHQEREFIRKYRSAVKFAAKGDVSKSFDQLDEMGCIRELATLDKRQALAEDYLSALTRKERVLVVAQTREEVGLINQTIREKLKMEGMLRGSSVIQNYQPIELGIAEKRDPRFFKPGQYACFLQRYGRFRKGEFGEIADANERGIVLLKDGRKSTLSYRYADRILVASVTQTEIAPGDRLQLKLNGKSLEGAALNNGELVTVQNLRNDGALVVRGDDGTQKTIAASQRFFIRGYAVTSYASQGKTVDTVVFADSENQGATNANQWYVTISRGRKRVIVFTSDKQQLRANLQRMGERALASDLKTPNAQLNSRNRTWTKRIWACIDRQRSYVSARAHVGKQRQKHFIKL